MKQKLLARIAVLETARPSFTPLAIYRVIVDPDGRVSARYRRTKDGLVLVDAELDTGGKESAPPVPACQRSGWDVVSGLLQDR